jgi:hypothetical protein
VHSQNDITNQIDPNAHFTSKPKPEDPALLKLVILDSLELEIGKEFSLTALGLKGISNRIKDGCVYAGCDPTVNDILLSSKEKGAGNRHFMIKYDEKFKSSFALRDLGEGMGTFIRIDEPLFLKANSIISFGDSHMITLINYADGNKITLKFIDGPKVDQKL